MIVDRGFCSQELLELLEELNLRYILMLKSNHKGYREISTLTLLRFAGKWRTSSPTTASSA